MASLLVIRRILALTLVVTLASMGVPVPVNASGEQEQPSAPNSVLTLNGQPIRQFISTTGHSRGAVLFNGLSQAQPSNGQISGVAVDKNGRRLVQHEVQLNRVFELGGQRVTGVATTTTDADGRFSFTGLSAGSFEVEVVADGTVIATSAELTLSEGAMVVSGITVVQPERSWVGRHPVTTGVLIGVGAFFGIVALICGTVGDSASCGG